MSGAQGAQEKAVDFTADLKQLFRQAFPEEDTKSIVLRQRFLTGLQPSVGCQVLLSKKPDTFEKAVTDAVEVEEELKLKAPKEVKNTQDAMNAVSSNPEAKPFMPLHDQLSKKIQESVDFIARCLEKLETKLQDAKPAARGTNLYQQSPSGYQRSPSG